MPGTRLKMAKLLAAAAALLALAGCKETACYECCFCACGTPPTLQTYHVEASMCMDSCGPVCESACENNGGLELFYSRECGIPGDANCVPGAVCTTDEECGAGPRSTCEAGECCYPPID